jgi:hypothetical protein
MRGLRSRFTLGGGGGGRGAAKFATGISEKFETFLDKNPRLSRDALLSLVSISTSAPRTLVWKILRSRSWEK